MIITEKSRIVSVCLHSTDYNSTQLANAIETPSKVINVDFQFKPRFTSAIFDNMSQNFLLCMLTIYIPHSTLLWHGKP
ncbi:hypothetical protein AVEN_91768-1 [Araneus ventricosus]|uniref:Uncharacterized protein n=1 Tax=Araneus ventricosus TaxID=182803 RepID=A0A4Y2Q679_ARAVE|nr:hypothetical protein AVEN_91768-1 [Araneus ventricosus]